MLSAADLKITEAEYAGLIFLKGYLASQKIPAVDDNDTVCIEDSRPRTGPLAFCMSTGAALLRPRFDCGCAACIGGHLSLHMQGLDVSSDLFSKDALLAARDYVYDGEVHSPSLHDLFYPHEINDWDEIKPPHAAQAIENFLTNGDPKWGEIL